MQNLSVAQGEQIKGTYLNERPLRPFALFQLLSIPKLSFPPLCSVFNFCLCMSARVLRYILEVFCFNLLFTLSLCLTLQCAT